MTEEITKAEKITAIIISYIFHPLLMPTVGLFLFFHSGTYLETMNDDAKSFLYIILGFCTCVLPLLSLPLFIYRRVIKNINMDSRSERIMPAVFTLVFYFLGYYMLNKLPIPTVITGFITSIVAMASFALLITIWWKISYHMMGLGGIIGALIALSIRMETNLQYYIIGSILIAGIVSTARLRLNAHTPLQILAGLFLGIAVVFGFVFFG
ncbi:MAG: hypothetical protein HY951_14600 [Bacteroidia bacterium]|nr:hypothetical protein [Bacteroidia bacterium]